MTILQTGDTRTAPTDRSSPMAAAPQAARGGLGRFMPRLVAGSMAVAALELGSGLLLDEPALLGSSLLTAAFAVMLIAAGGIVDSARERHLGTLLAGGVYLLGLLGAMLIPGAAMTSALLPILSVVLLLPGRSRRGVSAILMVAMVGSIVALLAGDLPHPFPPLREPLGSAFTAATLLGIALLILGALNDFASQSRDALDRMRSAMAAQDVAFAERTAIVASIGRLERHETLEDTATAIVDELMRFPGVHVAGVLVCRGQDLVTLALQGPPDFPGAAGLALPAARARHLLDRSSGGAWAERWVPDDTFGEYGHALTASGLVGQAYAPFHEGGRIIGIVAIGTCSEASAAHLVADLPAVAEFAATSSLLLAPMLAQRHEIEAARDAIEDLIQQRAHRPVFQPIVELDSGRVVGFEALTRFDSGRRPDLVFDDAARAGLGLELELATLATAVEAARALPPGASLSLNTSPALVVGETDALAAILARLGRPITLEITEHVAIDDYRAVRGGLDRLGSGIRVAVDDAGAGIANFSHLVELRPDMVKVDAGLIRHLDRDLARQAAVVGFVHFAAKAGCMVVAEGIETESERRTAAELGVTLGQGYLFAHPAPVSAFIPAPRIIAVA
jgi:EAL domain-containing protein (putative c-di-GMP-specific phosphodiesterase class I)